MAELSQEEMIAMQEQSGAPKDGEITKLVQQIGQGLSKLQQALGNSQSTTDQDKEQMNSILESFIDLVENKLGAEPGQDAESAEPQEMEQVPAQQGRSGVPVGPQIKN